MNIRPALKRAAFDYGIYVAFALEVLCFAAFAPGFLNVGNLFGVVGNSAYYLVMAVGMTFVIISGGIDLSVGSLVCFCGMVAAVMLKDHGDSLGWALLAVAAAVAAGALSGAFSASMISWFNIPPFIVTLALMMSLRAGAILYSGNKDVTVYSEPFRWLGGAEWSLAWIFSERDSLAWRVFPAAAVFVFGAVLLTRTAFGRAVVALGGNERAAYLSGINVRRVRLLVYGFSGCLVGLASVMSVGMYGSAGMQAGEWAELDVIAAVVIGGTSLTGGRGSMFGTLVGVLLLAFLRNGMQIMNINTTWQRVAIGVVILLAVMMDKFKKG